MLPLQVAKRDAGLGEGVLSVGANSLGGVLGRGEGALVGEEGVYVGRAGHADGGGEVVVLAGAAQALVLFPLPSRDLLLDAFDAVAAVVGDGALEVVAFAVLAIASWP
jgi:hypothetical protein